MAIALDPGLGGGEPGLLAGIGGDGKCLGVCKPNNVSTVLTASEQIWLGMFKSKKEYDVLLQWIKDSTKADKMLPLPNELEKHRFQRFKET